MAKVTYPEKAPEESKIEPGDIIATVNERHLMVGEADDDNMPWALTNVEDGQCYLFNHITHLINHVKKHYGTFVIIKSHRITITID